MLKKKINLFVNGMKGFLF